MSILWSDLVSQLDPYVAGEQPKGQGLIKLNTNENPYPPSPKVAQVLTGHNIDLLKRYPDPDSRSLKQAIARRYQLADSHVFVGNGSDEVLAFAFMAFFKQQQPILLPDITYSFYPSYCRLFEIDTVQIPLAEDFTIQLDQYQQANGGIIFANPNAPTTIALPLAEIKTLLQRNTDSVVIVDEAYVDFGAESAASLISGYPNLLVIQTLSKSRSLAGLRVGFAIGDAGLIDALERVKNSFNAYPLDRMAEAAAVAAIDDEEYTQQCCEKIMATREWTVAQLQQLGCEVLPSQTNFVMVKPSGIAAEEVFNRLRQKNIIIRYFNKPRISEYLRITIGTDEEMQQLLAALRDILL